MAICDPGVAANHSPLREELPEYLDSTRRDDPFKVEREWGV